MSVSFYVDIEACHAVMESLVTYFVPLLKPVQVQNAGTCVVRKKLSFRLKQSPSLSNLVMTHSKDVTGSFRGLNSNI